MKVFFSYKIPKSYCIILFFTFEIFYFKHKIYHIIYVWTITNSHTTTYIWILNVYTIPTFEKKNFKDKKISTFLQKSVLFFILFLHLKIFISIIRSCIDVYITFGKFHTYLNTYEDSIFKHFNIWKKKSKMKKLVLFLIIR